MTIETTRRRFCEIESRWVFSCLVAVGFVLGFLEWTPCLGQNDPLPAAELITKRNADKTLRQASYEKWSDEIRRLRSLDELETYPNNAILFLGSSSIRLWSTIAEDLAPFVPIRRGFGGAQSVDLAVHGPELIQARKYAAVVIFVANDISGEEGRADHQPDQVVDWLREVWQVSKEHQPTAPLLLIEVTPTQLRQHVWAEQRRLNERLREWSLTEENVYFLPTSEYFLDANDDVRPELFDPDQLHLNRAGYRIWGGLVRRRLEELLNQQANPTITPETR